MRVRCEAVRYLREPQPGVIEAYLTDANGFRWQIVEKTVMFHEYDALLRRPTLPMAVSLGCRVSRDAGGPTLTIYLTEVEDGGRVYEVERTTLIDG